MSQKETVLARSAVAGTSKPILLASYGPNTNLIIISSFQILETLFTTCQKAPSEEQRKYTNQCISGMKCLSSWIVLGLPMENMQPIFPHLFAAIRSEPLFESGETETDEEAENRGWGG